MSPTATLSKWGNGVGLLVPKAVRDALGLGVGDRVRFESTDDGRVELVPEGGPWTLHSLMAGYDGPAPDFVDPGASFGREVW